MPFRCAARAIRLVGWRKHGDDVLALHGAEPRVAFHADLIPLRRVVVKHGIVSSPAIRIRARDRDPFGFHQQTVEHAADASLTSSAARWRGEARRCALDRGAVRHSGGHVTR
jgi:hypothetical protein